MNQQGFVRRDPRITSHYGIHRETAVVVTRESQDEHSYDPKAKMRGHTAQEMNNFLDAKDDSASSMLGLTPQDYETITNGFNEGSNCLGVGSTGSTFHGRHHNLELVVKKINSNTKLEKEKKFQECRNPFVLPVWDICKQGGQSLIVYPFMRNGNLFDAVVKGKQSISYRKRIAIALYVASGLSFLHKKGIVYRQFKSSSILLDENLSARLGDYGLVQSSYGTDNAPGYLCPVFKADGKVRPENDLWGLGVVMLELLTGLAGSDEEGNDISSRLGIKELLDKPSEAVKNIFGNDMIVDVIMAAGWPSDDDRRIAQEFARLSVLCMNMTTLNDRISLSSLRRALKMLLNRVERTKRKDEPSALRRTGNECEYCLRRKASPLALPCGHATVCLSCLRTCDLIVCPQCSAESFRLAGNSRSFALVISGKGELPKDAKKGVSLDEQVFLQDSRDFVRLLTDRGSVGLREEQVYLMIASAKVKENCSFNNIRKKLFELKIKFQKLREDMKKIEHNDKLSLLVFLTGRFKNNGEMLLPGSTNLKNTDFLKELKAVDADNVLIFASGCDSYNFFGTDAFSKSFTNETPPRRFRTPQVSRSTSTVGSSSVATNRPHSFTVADTFQVGPGKLRFLSETAGMLKKLSFTSEDKDKPSSLWLKSSTTVYCYSPSSQGGFTIDPTSSAGTQNSFFLKYLLNGVEGATRCYNVTENKDTDPLRPDNPCDLCVKLNERLHSSAFLQLGEIMAYVCEHLQRHDLTFPKLIYDSGAKSMLFSFGGK